MALIKKGFIENLIYESDIVKLISPFVVLKKSGKNYVGLSPFTNEKTPSFMVNPVKQRFYDYSSNISGNIIDFIKKIKNLNFPEAVKYIAEEKGIDVQYDSKEYTEEIKARHQKKKSLLPALYLAHTEYQRCLKNLDVGHDAIIELKSHRKYSNDTITDWEIGYAPGNKFLYKKLEKNQLLTEGIELGLISNDNDKYFNRVIYPIYDPLGQLIGLSGRTLSNNKTAKWINPKESPVYKKHMIWFGLHHALREIQTKNEVYIVEGYNDVIAWQENGLRNTIGSCGTSITEAQIGLLKKICSSVVFCMDGDPPGLKSVLKHLPDFIKKGFKTKVVLLPDGKDPDDFVKEFNASIKPDSLLKTIENECKITEGFGFLIENIIVGDDFNKRTEAKKLCYLISKVEKDEYKSLYSDILVKSNNLQIPKSDISKWIKDVVENQKVKEGTSNYKKYKLPQEVKTPLSELEKIIDRYSLFIENNRVWILRGNEGKHYFIQASNFSIEIIQHMMDEKVPTKLIRIKNINGQEKVFDVQSEYLNTPQKFDNSVTAYGNFLWTGSTSDFQKLRAYLFDNMGNGRKIEVLGWQPEGFWVWNNKITLVEENEVNLDDNGIFILDSTSYYVPSANGVYKNNPFKYEPQKKLIVSETTFSFKEYTSKMIKVHGTHAIAGILFSVSSIYQDYIEKEVGGFPILFLYGPPSTGKDQLAFCCQSFFGQPQTAINLEGGASTIKGQIRTFAQLSNIICHLSEYKRGNPQIDGVLKGIWDKRGYVRGTIDSHVGTDNVPILCSAILTGNEYPDNDALITRLLWSEMTKSQFTKEEAQEFAELSEMIKTGISHLTEFFIKQRTWFVGKFKTQYKLHKDILQNKVPEAHSRILGNAAILIATYELFKDSISFPFNYNEMIGYFESGIHIQMRKLDSTNVMNRFWDCFLSSMKGNPNERINIGREYNIDGDILLIQFTHCYLIVQKRWYSQFQEQAPSKFSIRDALKKDDSFIGKKTTRLNSGRASDPRSVYQIDLNKIGVAEDIKAAIEWQNGQGHIVYNNDDGNKPPLPF